MEIIKDFESKKEEIKKRILNGEVFIYPTDTIYGIGCDATNLDSVIKLRLLKDLPGEKPMSVIAPSKQWIIDNCVIDERAEDWLDKLPGSYTLVIKMKNKKCIAKNVNYGTDALGVRIPDHWISSLCAEMNIPIVTTSANMFSHKVMTCVDDLDKHLKVDFVIDEGELVGKPSTIVFLDGDKVDVKER